MYRVVQLNYIPEIAVLYMLFERSLTIFTMTSLTHHMEYFHFLSKISWTSLKLFMSELRFIKNKKATLMNCLKGSNLLVWISDNERMATYLLWHIHPYGYVNIALVVGGDNLLE